MKKDQGELSRISQPPNLSPPTGRLYQKGRKKSREVKETLHMKTTKSQDFTRTIITTQGWNLSRKSTQSYSLPHVDQAEHRFWIVSTVLPPFYITMIASCSHDYSRETFQQLNPDMWPHDFSYPVHCTWNDSCVYRGGAAWQPRFWKSYVLLPVQMNKLLILDRRKAWKARVHTIADTHGHVCGVVFFETHAGSTRVGQLPLERGPYSRHLCGV